MDDTSGFEGKTILKRTVPIIIAGLAVFALYLLLFVDIEEMTRVIGEVNLVFYTLAFLVSIVEVAFFTLSWQYLLKGFRAVMNFRKSFTYSWIGQLVDLLVPAESIAGEIAKIYFASRDGVDPGKAAASVILQRIIGLFIIGATLVFGVFLMLKGQIVLVPFLQNLVYLAIVFIVVFLLLAVLIFRRRDWAHKLTEKIFRFIRWVARGRLKLDGWDEKANKTVDAFYESLTICRSNPTSFVAPVFFSILQWFFAVLVYYLTFEAIGYHIDIGILIVGYSIILGIKSIPVGIPAEVGVTEIAITLVFGASAQSAAVAILIRIITVWFRIIIGFAFFHSVGKRTLLDIKRVFSKKEQLELS